jgi:glutamine synthetase type III
MNLRSKCLLYVGIGAMFWGMCLSRNDVIFNKTSISSYMQVIFRGTHWARTWALFQKEENRTAIQAACRLVETMTMEIFAKHGWWFSNRLSL